jgi:sugar lactone lactonase YvrE
VKLTLLSVLLTATCLAQTNLPTYTVSTAAGSVPLGDGGPAASAVLRWPGALAFDPAGNLYIADGGNSSVRKITPDGLISTIAGTGVTGYSGDGGPGNQAQLSAFLPGLAIDSAGNVYVSDAGNNLIRKISAADGTISTVVDGSTLPNAETQFGFNGIAVDAAGSLYIVDSTYSQIFKIAPDGTFSVIAGTGKHGDSGDGGMAAQATFTYLWGICIDPSGNIYVSDWLAYRIRKITPDGRIRTVAGTQFGPGFTGDGGLGVFAQINEPTSVVTDPAGNVYFNDYLNSRIRRIGTDGKISTVAGTDNPIGYSSGDGGPATMAQLTEVGGIALSATGDLYIADYDSAIRVVAAADGTIRTAYGTPHFAGDGGPASSALFSNPLSIVGDGRGSFYIGDGNNFRIRKLDASGVISTIAGNGAYGNTGDGGPAASASLSPVTAIALGNSADIYFASGALVKHMTADGTITTVAGGGKSLGDGGPATSANLADLIWGLAVDTSGSLYIADSANSRIRKVTPDGKISTMAGKGVQGDSGDGGRATAASIWEPRGLAVDAAGNLYFADYGANRVRKIAPDGTISAFAGTGSNDYTGDGGPAIKAKLDSPWGITADQTGNVYICDWNNNAIRVVTTDGVIRTIASGNAYDFYGFGSFSGDGGPAIGADYSSVTALALDGAGQIYLLDSLEERIRVLTPQP